MLIRICAVLLLSTLAFVQVSLAEDFTVYTNRFANGDTMAASPDGRVWFKSGGFLLGFEPVSEQLDVFSIHSASGRNRVTVDTSGVPWIHCYDAIVRVINGHVETFLFPEAMGQFIAASPDGSVWAFFTQRQSRAMRQRLLRFDGVVWQDIDNPEPKNSAEGICVAPDGAVWLSWCQDAVAEISKLGRYKDAEWQLFPDLPYGMPEAIAATAEGDVWVTVAWDGVYHIRDGACVAKYTPDEGLAGWDSFDLKIDGLGRVWVGDAKAGVSMFDGDHWTIFNTLNSGLPSDSVKYLAVAPDGSLWFTTGGGLARYKDGLWKTYTGGQSTVMNNEIWSVAVDRLGRAFYGTWYGQVGYFDGIRWDVLYDPGTAYADYVYSIAFGLDDMVWLACHSCLKAWRGTIIEYGSANGMRLDYSTDLCFDQDSNLWVCASQGLAKYDGQSWSCFQAYAGDPPRPVTPDSIACDHDGRIWVGTWIGVAAIKDDQLVAFLPDYQYVNAIECDKDGLLWFGFGASERGLLEFDGTNEIAWYTTDDGLPSNRINCIECDSPNNIWVGTDRGLGYFDRTAWTKYSIDTGFAVNEIRDIFAAPNGDVWFATPAGLICRESGIQPPGPRISIATDKQLYQAGEAMTVLLSYENPGPAVNVDIQIACQLPDGSLYYYPGGDTPVPFSSGLLPSGTKVPMVLVLTYEFPSGFPVGDYTWMTAMFQQGTFNMITDIATAPFAFQ